MKPIITIDLSTACFGLAWGVTTPKLKRVLVLDEPGGIMQRTALERLWPALDRALEDVMGPHAHDYHADIPLDFTVDLVIERPPPNFKDKGDGRAKRQAVIGVGIGRAMELAAVWGYMQNRGLPLVRVRFIENGTWRAWAAERARTAPDTAPKVAASARAPTTPLVTARPPTRRADGPGWVMRYQGCEHELVCENLVALQNRPQTCHACAALGATSGSHASKASTSSKPHPLEHKRPWVELATRLWPDAVDEVVREARATARSADEPYQLTGVADACDAALLWGFVSSTA